MSASLPVFGRLVLFPHTTSRPARKPTHGTYFFFRRSATAFCPRFHHANFSDVSASGHRLGSVPPAPLCDRRHLLQRQRGQRALVALPSLLQSCGLGHGCPLSPSRQTRRRDPRSPCHLALA